MTSKLHIISIIQFLLLENCISIILPIKTNIPIFNKSNIIPYYTSNQLYSILEVGSPIQKVILLLTLKENSFYLSKIDKIDKNDKIIGITSQYNYTESSTSIQLTEFDQKYGNENHGCFISDNFYFLENLKEPKKLYKNITFYLPSKDDINLYFIAGIGLQKSIKDKGFLDALKDLDYIKAYDWFLNYTNKDYNEEIKLIIGTTPHEYYPDYFSENQILSMNSYCSVTYLKWGILFNKIYVNEKSFNDFLDSEINFNYNSIIIPNDYWDYISNIYFNEYINLNICSIMQNSDKMRYFTCDKNKFNKNDISKAPIIYFYSVQFKYTFEIKGENLFELKNDKYYFLLFSQTYTYSWILGKPFFKKYPFLYNIESKTISFYNPNIPYISSNHKNKYKYKKNYIGITIILSFIFIIIMIYTLFLLSKHHRQRKIRSNELEDEFVYKPHENNSIIFNDK